MLQQITMNKDIAAAATHLITENLADLFRLDFDKLFGQKTICYTIDNNTIFCKRI